MTIPVFIQMNAVFVVVWGRSSTVAVRPFLLEIVIARGISSMPCLFVEEGAPKMRTEMVYATIVTIVLESWMLVAFATD